MAYSSEPGDAAEALPKRNTVETTISDYAGRLVMGIARHWLALFNLAWATYVVLPFLAPILMAAGLTAPARLIYGIYSFTCHQLPDHSYFLFGPSAAPGTAQLEAMGLPSNLNLFAFREFVGNPDTGYKVALCQRDVAIYGSVLVAGLLFGILRNRLSALPIRLYLLFLIPIGVDGLSQLFGLRESNWWLRTVTGVLFGMASVWLAYPYIDDAMQDVIKTEMANQAGRSPA